MKKRGLQQRMAQKFRRLMSRPLAGQILPALRIWTMRLTHQRRCRQKMLMKLRPLKFKVLRSRAQNSWLRQVQILK